MKSEDDFVLCERDSNPDLEDATRDLRRATAFIDVAGQCVASALARLRGRSSSHADEQDVESIAEALTPDDLQLLKAIQSFQAPEDGDDDQSDDPSHALRSAYGRGAPVEEYGAGHADWLSRRRDVFARYEQSKECFTDKQWTVVCAYYRDGLTEDEIADRLGVARGAVYDRRRRAEQRLKKREAELRKERLRLMRNLTISH